MSSEQQQIRSIAERIARRLSEQSAAQQGGARSETSATAAASDNAELSALRARLAEIQQRLAHLESHITHDASCDSTAQSSSAVAPRRRQDTGSRSGAFQSPPDEDARAATEVRSTWLSGTYVPAAHPSEERFGITEAVSELVDYFEREKTCTVEPGGKPCDHCGMCNSRGF